jgi:hypothetical protein
MLVRTAVRFHRDLCYNEPLRCSSSIGRSEKTCGADASEDRMSKAQLAWRLAAFVKARA